MISADKDKDWVRECREERDRSRKINKQRYRQKYYILSQLTNNMPENLIYSKEYILCIHSIGPVMFVNK